MARRQRVLIPYTPRPAFKGFHHRKERWACIVAHRRAGKTVAAVNELIRAAMGCERPEPRFAYVAPFTSLVLGMAPTDPGGKWWGREASPPPPPASRL
jgi:hypothetical protein